LYTSQHISPQLVLGFLDLGLFSAQKALKEKREIEKQGAIYVLSEMLNSPGIEISYDVYGKPYLEGSTLKISLSHSHQWLLAAVHQKEEVGVDIEQVKDKIKNIATRFLSEEELKHAMGDSERLTLYWAAKEAVYKAYGKKQIEFRSAIAVQPFAMQSEGEITATLFVKEEERFYKLYYRKHHQYLLAITL
jgi:4'-phosphopantetheinyl transferase